MDATVITIFGSSQPAAGSAAYATALELGKAIADAGWTVCNGGYGGTMEATARGAVDAGGHTIGVTWSKVGRGKPNAYIRQEVPTFDLLQRLNTLVHLGKAYVVLPGGTGTGLELMLVWELLNKGLLKRRGPLILLGEHWSALVECVQREQAECRVPEIASDPEHVVRILRAHFSGAAD